MSISGISNHAPGLMLDTHEAPDAPAGTSAPETPQGIANINDAIKAFATAAFIEALMDQDPDNPMSTPPVTFDGDYQSTW